MATVIGVPAFILVGAVLTEQLKQERFINVVWEEWFLRVVTY